MGKNAIRWSDSCCSGSRIRSDQCQLGSAEPNWHWSDRMRDPLQQESDHLIAFFPISRFSRRALAAIHSAYQDPGWQGYFEMLIPTIVARAGLSVGDIGGDGPISANVANAQSGARDDCRDEHLEIPLPARILIRRMDSGERAAREARDGKKRDQVVGFLLQRVAHPVRPVPIGLGRAQLALVGPDARPAATGIRPPDRVFSHLALLAPRARRYPFGVSGSGLARVFRDAHPDNRRARRTERWRHWRRWAHLRQCRQRSVRRARRL